MSPKFAFAFTVASVITVIFFTHFEKMLACAVIMAVLISATDKSFRNVIVSIKWTIPFVLPLLIVHGIINPVHPCTFKLYGLVPFRPSGFIFSLLVSLKIEVLTMTIVAWRSLDSNQLLNEAVRFRFPMNMVIIIAVASSTVNMIGHRIEKVYLAQQARGIPAGPGIIARIRALPAIILPVITATLSEGAIRGDVMLSRGLGTTTFMPTEGSIDLHLVEKIYIIVLFTSVILVWLWI
jgi:energy-coupling factor transporter transmembrane protein EcfT